MQSILAFDLQYWYCIEVHDNMDIFKITKIWTGIGFYNGRNHSYTYIMCMNDYAQFIVRNIYHL